jgi:hypothetical protein
MFTKINKMYNKKNYLDKKKSKQEVFFNLVIKSKNNTKCFLSKKVNCVFDIAMDDIF